MSIAPTREPSAPPAPEPVEVLIKEARRRGRRLYAQRAMVVLVVVALVAAILFVVLAARPSGSVPVTAPTAPTAAVPIDESSSTTLGVLPPGITSLGGVACSSPTACVIVGTGGIGGTDRNLAYHTTDAGVVWSRAFVPGIGVEMANVACAGATCVSSGGYQLHTGRIVVDRSTNGGASWVASTPPIDARRAQIDSIACPTEMTCLLSTGVSLYWSVDAGATWHRAAVPVATAFGTLACMSVTACVATAKKPTPARSGDPAPSYVMRSSDAGRTWSIVLTLPPSDGFLDPSCPTPTSCSVLELPSNTSRLRILTTNDAGSSWTVHTLPRAISTGGGLACPTALECVAWSSSFEFTTRTSTTTILRTHDGGSTWSRQTDAHPGVAITLATCSSATTCELIGSDDVGVVVMGSRDAGHSWAFQSLPPGVLQVTGTACTSLKSCVIAIRANRGDGAYVTPNAGIGWTAAPMPTSTAALTEITCPTATFCAGAANGIVASSDAGSTWTLTRFSLGDATLNGISCTSSASCVLVGGTAVSLVLPGGPRRNASVVLLWRGGRLHRVPVSGVTSQLQAVSCTVGETCVAVGGALGFGPTNEGPPAVAYSHDGGHTWSRATIPVSVAGLSAISCPTAQVCIAAGWYNGQPGSEPQIISSIDGGTHWSVVPTVHRNGGYLGVACATAARCVATGVWGERDKPFSVLINAPGSGGPFSALRLTTPSYSVVGRISSGAVFGVPSNAPADQPRIVRIG